MHACPFTDCDYKTLQKSNMQTHIRTHTRERSKTCPHPGCEFATTDPGSLTRHRKQLHGYEPKARRNFEAEIPASLDLNFDLTFPELSGLIPCSALSPAESSNSGFSSDFTDFSWEQLFPDLSAESFSTVYSQPCQLPVPIPTSKDFQPATVPVDLSTLHMPQYDTQLFSDVDFQYQPVSNGNLQFDPTSPMELPVPARLRKLFATRNTGARRVLQKHGSGTLKTGTNTMGRTPWTSPRLRADTPSIKSSLSVLHFIVHSIIIGICITFASALHLHWDSTLSLYHHLHLH
ncbi:hypothetical protein DFH29DRAFT_1085512 [Suillus ampliporus]|nr:hypothetical protein DFH29DRAFT_1085512 [Suillus ampliporus]